MSIVSYLHLEKVQRSGIIRARMGATWRVQPWTCPFTFPWHGCRWSVPSACSEIIFFCFCSSVVARHPISLPLSLFYLLSIVHTQIPKTISMASHIQIHTERIHPKQTAMVQSIFTAHPEQNPSNWCPGIQASLHPTTRNVQLHWITPSSLERFCFPYPYLYNILLWTD